MEPVLHDAVRREYDSGVANGSIEILPAPTELILELMPVTVDRFELSTAWICVNCLNFTAVAVTGGAFGASSKARYHVPENLVE
jgi:hypothetical protein